MAAAVYYFTLYLRDKATGAPWTAYCYSTDVTAAYVQFVDNASNTFLPVPADAILEEIDVVTGPTDCSRLIPIMNGTTKRYTLYPKTYLTSLPRPHFAQKILVEAGTLNLQNLT